MIDHFGALVNCIFTKGFTEQTTKNHQYEYYLRNGRNGNTRRTQLLTLTPSQSSKCGLATVQNLNLAAM